jgi:hypothetical protein
MNLARPRPRLALPLALVLAPACLQPRPPEPSIATVTVTIPGTSTRPGLPAAPAASVSATPVPASWDWQWQPGRRPRSNKPENCGTKEVFFDLNDISVRNDPQVTQAVCLATTGCPAREPLVLPTCKTSLDPILDLEAFVAKQSYWQEGAYIRIRARIFIDRGDGLARFTVPLGPWDGSGPDCYRRGSRSLTLQAVTGDTCYEMSMGGGTPTMPFKCDGDISRSCCGHLPLGESLVVSGKLSVSEFEGILLPRIFPSDICRE